jgi:group I intron endonuclease
MKISGIYQIQSKLKPNRIYIGSAFDITQRWRSHLSLLRNNKQVNKKLQNHFNKYGEADLCFTILLGCEKIDLLKIEQYFIDSYKPYFNICLKAESQFGLKRSAKTKLRISKSKKGSVPWNKGKKGIYSADTLLKMSAWQKGGKHSDESNKKISASMTGKPHKKGYHQTVESNKKRSASMMGKNVKKCAG